MKKKLRIVLAQLNFTVGDIEGNLQKHIQAAIKARDELNADVIVFPELSLTGYPPEDLLLRKSFIDDAQKALQTLGKEVNDIYCLVGTPYPTPQGLHNACVLIYNGTTLATYAKQFLPNYEVFDEYRYFIPGNMASVVPIKGVLVGIVVCEDAWVATPIHQAAQKGAQIILVPNASPFEVDKHEARLSVLNKRAQADEIPILYVNTVGAQDDMVYDGGSMVVDQSGKLCQLAGFFKEALFPVDIIFENNHSKITFTDITLPTNEEKIYQALVLGLRDYIEKNGFRDVLIGVSGGIDSALTLTIAVDALGAERVQAVLLPSRYTADMSNEDAHLLAKNLGVKTKTISIEKAYKSFLETLEDEFSGKKADVTEENIQARVRATILMALSNKTGALVLTTGNRSELAVGYCTLYGDMAGGFAVLKDVPKTFVYKLADYRNQIKAVIPQRTIERAPSAELAPNQTDQDTLPPYPVLDEILELYLNQQLSTDEIIRKGFDAKLVNRIADLIRKNEYKRKQGAIGTRINHTAFGKDRRYPNTNRYKK